MIKRFCIVQLFLLLSCTINVCTWRFAWEAWKNPSQVGAMFSCSRQTGHELMRYAKKHKEKKNILEIGAGTGSVTAVISFFAKYNDFVDVVEINPPLCTELRATFPKENNKNLNIHCADIMEFNPGRKYDFIICTLPFNNFDKTFIVNVQKKIMSFAKKGCRFSYVEYMVLPRIRRNFFTQNANAGKMLDERKNAVEEFKKKYLIETVKVFRNTPPLYVHHLRF